MTEIEFEGTHIHELDKFNNCIKCGKNRKEILFGKGHDDNEFGRV